MKLKTKLLSAFSAVCIIGSVVSAIGIESMSAISNQADLTYKQDLIGVALTQEANVDLLYVGRSIRNAILASTDEQRAKFLAESDKDLELTRTNLDKAKPLFYSERGKAKFAEVEQSWKDYVDAVAQMRTKASSTSLQDRGTLTDYLFGDFAQRVNHVDNLLSDLTDIKEQNAKTAAESNLRRYQLSRDVMIALVLASLGFGIGIGSWITRGVTRQLGAEPDAATGLAQSVASGDLTVPINLRAGDTTSLMASLQTMRDSLATVVADVRQNAENVATASAEIAQGNLDLSSRTEEQASALQQTAASMEELSTTVTQNAENAKQANQLALDANTIAAKGGEVFEDVVSNMKSVNESSQRIADIISVIDGIAFQTNILALNAAVEAARAGDHGRGFAVVASEVRNLAQRSAAAAKEIKTLIQASVDSVQEGSALVDQAGTTMQDVVVAIQRVTDIMGEISAASSEQSIGVAQVGEAVSQMDQVTQQNAALVEESAAAAESLKSQSTLLVQAVAVFKLAGDKHRVAREPSANASSVVRKRIVAAAPPVQKSAKVVSVSSPVREPVVGTAVAAGGDWQTF